MPVSAGLKLISDQSLKFSLSSQLASAGSKQGQLWSASNGNVSLQTSHKLFPDVTNFQPTRVTTSNNQSNEQSQSQLVDTARDESCESTGGPDSASWCSPAAGEEFRSAITPGPVLMPYPSRKSSTAQSYLVYYIGAHLAVDDRNSTRVPRRSTLPHSVSTPPLSAPF